MEFLQRQWSAISAFSFCQFYGFVRRFPFQDVSLNGRRFHVVKQLGEGGYAYVYLVKEKATGSRFALKRLHAGSGEQLQAARNEVQIMQKLTHPNLLRLLDYVVEETAQTPAAAYDEDYSASHVVWMLFPAYEHGSLFEELGRLHEAGRPMLARCVLDIFLQLCLGLQHMHQVGLAHRDVKPHNVLLEPANNSASEPSSHLLDNDVEAGSSSGRYHAVIVDFGSAGAARRQVGSRLEALAVQEEAERNCTAPYRAPELFDVPSSCTIDERIDVWSLGCTLYHMMYGASPFQKIMDQGGSLALAVMECDLPWPKLERERYPEELHCLVLHCLTVDPSQRPFVQQVIDRCQELMELPLHDPQVCARV